MNKVDTPERVADGRSARWEKHRHHKKKELTAAALRAIRSSGARIGMGEIAESAGTSKTVYYRHFTDKAGLWSAVVDRTVDFIYNQLPLDKADPLPLPDFIAELADSYLSLVDRDPEIYEFVTERPVTGAASTASSSAANSANSANSVNSAEDGRPELTDPVVTLTSRIAVQLGEELEEQGFGEKSGVWAQAIVGAIWAIADRWMDTGRQRPREEIVELVRDLFTPALTQGADPRTTTNSLEEFPVSTSIAPTSTPLSPLGRDLRAALDGQYHDFKQGLRDRLDPATVVRPHDQSIDQARDWVLRSMHDLVDFGFNAFGMPEEFGGELTASHSILGFETLAMGDLSLTIKSGVQQGLFGGAILNLGDEDQRARWLPGVMNLDILGCYAMTERGRGSDVQNLETTITYIPADQEFEIHTPDDDAVKTYIGNAARDGRMAAVFGQLIVGEENHGVHCIIVDVRDDAGNALDGVTLGDNGHKGGLIGVDNGTIAFDHVRVPRENLLNRYGNVDADGVYSSSIEKRGKRFSTMLSTLVRGRISVGGAASAATRRGLTIAVRHAQKRTQFNRPTGEPITILEYQTHQRKLMPELARAYAYGFAQNELIRQFQQVQDDPEAGERATRELEAHAAGMKAAQTRWANDTLQVCREACGGYGYMAENGLTTLKDDADVFATFEGDNTVLQMLVGRALLANFQSSWSELDVLETARRSAALVGNRILERTTARSTIDRLISIASRKSGEEIISARGWHVEMFEFREKRMIESLGLRMRAVLKVDKEEQFDAFNLCQNHMIAASIAHIDRITLEAFIDAVGNTEEGQARDMLIKLCDLYALSTIKRHRGWFLEHDGFDSGRSRAITAAIDRLSAELAKDADAIVEGLGVNESWLNSVIATK